VQPDERFLNEVLGGIAIIGKETRHPHQGRTLLCEQVGNQRVPVDADQRNGHISRPFHSHEKPADRGSS
jgi:hypothetical protein